MSGGPDGGHHGQDVLGRNLGLDVVDAEGDIPRAQILDAPANLGAHLGWCAVGQDVLAVHRAPECQAVAELALQPRRVHTGGGYLHRVQDFDADIDEVGDEGVDRAATVERDPRGRSLAEEPDQAGHPRLEDAAEHLRRDQRAGLHPVIVGQVEDVHRVADGLQGFLGHGELDVEAAIQQRLAELRVHLELDQPVGETAHELPEGEEPSRDVDYQRAVRVPPQAFCLLSEPRHVRLLWRGPPVGVQICEAEVVLLERRMGDVIMAFGGSPPHHAPDVRVLCRGGVGYLVEDPPLARVLCGVCHHQAEVHVEQLQDGVVRPRQERALALHLHRGGKAEVALEPLVGVQVDPAGGGAAEIHGGPIRHLAVDDGQHPIAVAEQSHATSPGGT